MKGIRDNGVPEFKTLEEERAYWEARGPLAEGRKGRINRPKSGQKRSSFLVVRLTGEELTRLRDIAAKQGLGPSTFARQILTLAIQGESRKQVSFEEFTSVMSNKFSKEDLKKAEFLIKDLIIGDPENPALLVFSGQRRKWEEFVSLIFERLLGIQVVPTKNENLKKVRDLVEQ